VLWKKMPRNKWTKAEWIPVRFSSWPLHYRPKFHSPATFREIMGVGQNPLHIFCRPRKYTTEFLVKSCGGVVKSFCWNRLRCWWPPVTGYQVTVVLLRSLCSCWENKITTVHRCCWTPTRLCAVTATLHSLHQLWLDGCVLHQQTTFQSSQASNLLSFVAIEPHCL